MAVTSSSNRKKNLVLSVAENYRRDPINRLLRALLDDGAIGAPRLVMLHSVGGGDVMSMTPWRYQKHTASMPVDAGVHYADILRYYMGEVRSVYGESRLHEPTRRNTKSAGPGGFYARWISNYPDTIEATGDDALYAHISFQNCAVGHWVSDHAGHGKGFGTRQIWGSKAPSKAPATATAAPSSSTSPATRAPPRLKTRRSSTTPPYSSPTRRELFGASAPGPTGSSSRHRLLRSSPSSTTNSPTASSTAKPLKSPAKRGAPTWPRLRPLRSRPPSAPSR